MRFLLLLPILAACQPAPYSYQTSCFRFDSEIELDPDQAEARSVLAKSMTSKWFSTQRFCDIRIHVRAEGKWDCDEKGNCVLGYFYGAAGGIELNNIGESLVHELFHAYEYIGMGDANTGAHERWTEKGFHAASTQFKREMQEWRKPEPIFPARDGAR